MKPTKSTSAPRANPSAPQRPATVAAAPTRPSRPSAPATRTHAPTPPAVYRPQPLQKCLQPKRPAGLPPQAPATPRAPQRPARTQPQQPAPVRPDSAARRTQTPHAQEARGVVLQPRAAKPRTQTQPAAASVVQAKKLYPNLHPGAVESIDPGNVYKLSNFADQYRLRKTQSHGVYVPNQLYNFVRTSEGEMLLHNRYRHPSIAEGRQVLYAGEVYFNNGKLEWWSNGSGHYQPDSEDAQQAALPIDHFYSYQQIIKGEHKSKRK